MLQRLFSTKGPLEAKRDELSEIQHRMKSIDEELSDIDQKLATGQAAKEKLWAEVRPDNNGPNAEYSALIENLGNLFFQRRQLSEERLALQSRASRLEDLVNAPERVEQARKTLAEAQSRHQEAIATAKRAGRQLSATESRIEDARSRSADLGASVARALADGVPVPAEAQAGLGLLPALEAAFSYAQNAFHDAQRAVAETEAAVTQAKVSLKGANGNQALAEAEQAILPVRVALARAAAAQGVSFRRIEFTTEELEEARAFLEK